MINTLGNKYGSEIFSGRRGPERKESVTRTNKGNCPLKGNSVYDRKCVTCKTR